MSQNRDEYGPKNDFGREVIMNSDGDPVTWQSMLQGDGLDGWDGHNPKAWVRDGDSISGDSPKGGGGGNLKIGDSDWANYEVSFDATLHEGSYLDFQFRFSPDGPEGYTFELRPGWHAAVISKVTPDGWIQLSVVNLPVERGREYNIIVAARGQSLTSYIDGMLLNQVTDDTFPSGAVRFTLWKRNIVQYRNPRIRHYT